jgi:UDP-N-acetylglucosamine 2-epimerase
MSHRRILYCLAKKSGKPSFVMSHGFPGVLIGKEIRKESYTASITFAQSEIEKESYETLGYHGSDIRVTGVPRYDRIHRMIADGESKKNGTKIILYCAGSIREYDFLTLSAYAGRANFFAPVTRQFTRDLFEALKHQNNYELWIKPHYDEQISWDGFFADPALPKIPFRFFSHKEDIFKLESQADVVVTPESSVICESWMFKKPVILFNYADLYSFLKLLYKCLVKQAS